MQFTPYLSFQGQCADAMAFYAAIFGGTPKLMRFSDMPDQPGMPELPPEQKDWVMHADLTLPEGSSLFGADMPPQFGGQTQSGVSVTTHFPDTTKAKSVFERLSEGGTVTMPFNQTFFSPGFGMCKDRFGTSWMVMTDEAT